MLRSDLCDFRDAYIVVKGNFTVTTKAFTADDFDLQLMQMLLILQTIMHLVKRNWF